MVAKARRALFGDDFGPLYDLLKNRLVFLDGGKDDVYFLDHYVLLGNYARDLDRFEAMDMLFQDFCAMRDWRSTRTPRTSEAKKEYERLLEQAQATREDIANLEAQAGAARKKIERGDGFITKFISSGDPANQ